MSPPYLLYLLSVLGTGTAFVTQMLVSSYWSTAYGNDVLFFSVDAGIFLLGVALGAHFAVKRRGPGLAGIVLITALACLWSGLSLSILKLGARWLGDEAAIPAIIVLVSGGFSGFSIRLMLRSRESQPRLSLSVLFLANSSAALLFTLIFVFGLLERFGFGMTALLLSASCGLILVALAALLRLWDRSAWVALGIGLTLPYPVHSLVAQTGPGPKLRRDAGDGARLVHREQTRYHKIVLTEERGENPQFPGVPEHVLYMDGLVRFSSHDEQSYHTCLANVPVWAAELAGAPVRTALVLGGGDGLVARNLLWIPRIKKITLVELDPALLRLAKSELKVRMYNLDSLRNPKVEVIAGDAYQWIREAKGSYDVVILDFPLPRNSILGRLFSAEFYSGVFKLVSPNGFVAIPSGRSHSEGEPSSATYSRASASIKRTLESLGKRAVIYESPRANRTFVLATASKDFDAKTFFAKSGMLTGRKNTGLCLHSPDRKEPSVSPSTLNHPSLSTYLASGNETDEARLGYRGSRSVFLPE